MAGPLDGIKVVDFSAALAGPLAAGILGDLGADVIKIEAPGFGDVVRYIGPSIGGVSTVYQMANRSKRAVTIDLTKPQGVKLALELCAEADVVVQNFRPGVGDRLGVGWDAIQAANPQSILLAVTGFGSVGPYRDRPAYDTVIQALSGLTHVEAGDDGAARNLRQLGSDKISGIYASNAVLAALVARERGAGGQLVEVAMLEANTHFVWLDAAGRAMLGDYDGAQPDSPSSTVRPLECADGWIFPTQVTDKQFVSYCAAFGVDVPMEEATIAFRSTERVISRERNDKVLAAIRETPVAEVVRRLVEGDVPCGWSLAPADQPADPHFAAAEIFHTSQHPTAGSLTQPRIPMHFSGTPVSAALAAPHPGRDTDAIVRALGHDPQPLRDAGIIE